MEYYLKYKSHIQCSIGGMVPPSLPPTPALCLSLSHIEQAQEAVECRKTILRATIGAILRYGS